MSRFFNSGRAEATGCNEPNFKRWMSLSYASFKPCRATDVSRVCLNWKESSSFCSDSPSMLLTGGTRTPELSSR